MCNKRRPDPLDHLLTDIARRARAEGDRAGARWAERLLRGEKAAGGAAEKGEAAGRR